VLAMKTPRAAGVAGFTLIELLVTISILAILLSLAVPSFIAFQRNSELTSAANSLSSALNAARSEAMKRNLSAMVVPLDSGRTDWTKGWIVFVDTNQDGLYTAGTDRIVLTREALPGYFTVTGTDSASASPSYIMYDGSGFLRTTAGSSATNTTLSISRNDLSGSASYAQIRRLKVALTGRIRVCTPASSTDAACSANAGSL
jgi:type IV fimbrial biogenesis protein FimT